jgi:Plant transposon protein
MLDGSFHTVEAESRAIPYDVNGMQFTKLFLLVYGIYPSYSRFVRGIKQPITQKQNKLHSVARGIRQDVERAFGVLKDTWQCLDTPFLLHSLDDISERVACCLLLHNMIVTDRVMAEDDYNYRKRYDPSHVLDEEEGFEVEQPPDLASVQRREEGETRATEIGIANLPPNVQRLVTRAGRFRELDDKQKNQRLHSELLNKFGRGPININYVI